MIVEQRVLVTGASGFVGRALVTALREADDISVVPAFRVAIGKHFHPHVAVGDINGDTNWEPALQGVSAVAHLAARVHVMNEASANPLAEFRRVNVDGTMALARQAAAAGVRRFVYVSSIKVNGERGLFTERDAPAPSDPYGVSKLEAESALRTFATTSGMEVVILRPPLVYGPGVKANFRALMNAVNRGYPLPFGAIHNKRSLVSLDNLVSLILLVLSHPRAANETFLVSDGDDLSTPELVRRMGLALGKNARLINVPTSLLRTLGTLTGRRAMIDRLLDSLQVDITKARGLLGWSPPLSVDEGLRQATNTA